MAIIERPEIRPEDLPVLEADKPDGPVAAAVLAGGIGSAALGFFTILAEASPAAKRWLEWNSAVGSLSGKTTMAVVVWLVAWVGLHLGLRNRSFPVHTAVTVTLVLVAIGVVATFPPVFEAFASE